MDPNHPFCSESSYVSPYGLLPPQSSHLHEMQPPQYMQQHLPPDYHKRSGSSSRMLGSPYMTLGDGCASSTSGCADSDTTSISGCSRRKNNSDYDDDLGEDSRSVRTSEGRRQNHSEIEKRRRDKMNTYIMELSSMIPRCGGSGRKLDKLTVLRMAVQHLKSVHGAAHQFPQSFTPEFLSEREMKMLIMQAADGFIFVADCDRGRMMYVSESVSRILLYAQNDLLGQSLFDILHPKDVAKVKEQLSSPDNTSRERLVDAKTMLPVHMDVVTGSTQLSSGARRSFFCRMKVKPNLARHEHDRVTVKQEHESVSSRQHGQQIDRKYCVVQCTGYLKAWASTDMNGASQDGSDEEDNCGSSTANVSCLVAVGRTMPDPPLHVTERPLTRRLMFVSRHAPDGKFLYVDQRVTPAVGYLSQELLGTSLYEYVAPSHTAELARTHKAVLFERTSRCTAPYFFRRKDRLWSSIQTDWRPFRNPWTKELECLVAQNTILELYTDPPSPIAEPPSNDYFLRVSESDQEMQQVISSQIESHKIGSAIADEVLRQNRSSAGSTPNLQVEVDMCQEIAVYNPQVEEMKEANVVPGTELSLLSPEVRNNVVLSDGAQPDMEDVLHVIAAPALPDLTTPDGNDEAAMAVIMSLLEADAGLGGPVDFSGLPWPLP